MKARMSGSLRGFNGAEEEGNCCSESFPTAEASDAINNSVSDCSSPSRHILRQPILVTQIIILLNAFAATLKLQAKFMGYATTSLFVPW